MTMERPNITRQSRWISLSYWVSPKSEVHNYVPTISPEEDNQIRQWVNENYDLYGDDYKMAAYRDAQQAVLDRKATVERKAILERERKERAEKAAYEWDDRTLNEQKQLARAENAINDAATLIRQWQEANWIKVDKTLTNKETVDKFLEANLEMPYAEYVNKFLDAQTWKSWENTATYDNKWLAAKLWLLWWVEWALINAWDKLRAWTKWFAQWLANLTQNTIWAWAEYLASNLAAWLWEIWYWAAEMLWADVSEGTAWDKMKKMKWYDWKEAQRQASSEDLFKEWMLTEDVWAYNVWEWLWELTTELALTAPASSMTLWALSTKIPAATKAAWAFDIAWKLKLWNLADAWKLGKAWLLWLKIIDTAWEWALFQAIDDASKWKTSSINQYLLSAWLSAWTAWVFNVIWKLIKSTKWLWYKLFAPKWQEETALLTQTPQQRAKKTEINKAYAKNKNAIDTPYTEIANDIEKTAEKTLWWRLEKWWELWKIRAFGLQFKKWWRYDAKDALKTDINEALMQLANKKRFGNLAWDKELIPQFSFTKNWLEVSNPDVMNNIYREETTRDWWTKLVKLWDEVKNVYSQTYWGWAKVNAATTEEFLRWLDRVFSKKWWVWWPNNLTALMKEWIENATKKFENSLTEKSLADLQKARAASESAIETDKNLNKILWTLRNSDMVWKVWAAEKALWGKAKMEQLFKEINEKYWIDMNNEILSWAYNMSLYDVKKAEDLLKTFYPSEPWIYELLLRQITKSWRRKYAEKVVEKWAEWMANLGKVSPSVPAVWATLWAVWSTQAQNR